MEGPERFLEGLGVELEDPVDGARFRASRTSPRRERDGRFYLFSSEETAARFDAGAPRR